jgi:hypothetical protein
MSEDLPLIRHLDLGRLMDQGLLGLDAKNLGGQFFFSDYFSFLVVYIDFHFCGIWYMF